MQNKLQELTDKIYREGISRANEEAETILTEARNESKRIVEAAEKKAAALLADATKKSDEVLKNGTSELKISFRHAVNTLKQDLEKTISSKILTEKVNKALNDENFVADIIKIIYQNWKPQSPASGMEVLIPADKIKDIEKRLKAEIASELGSGLILRPVSSIKSGFEIISGSDGVKISATATDIEAYLKEFIRPKLNELLFEDK
jgi:V/A-type H+/Na+-transporting ATPase subunit E